MKAIIAITLLTLSFSSLASLFDSEEKIEIQIEGNLSNLLDDRNEKGNEPSYHKMKFTINTKNKVFEDYKSVKTHGGLRALKYSCDYPPMIIRSDNNIFFPKGKVFFTPHCNDRTGDSYFPKGNANLHREYLVYKLYQSVTNLSVRARLAKITYIDLQKDRAKTDRYGIFTQNINELAEKNGYQSLLERKGFSASEKLKIDKENYALVTMFQWLIGNQDFFIKENQIRNIAIVRKNNTLLGIPYDFDMSRFVSRLEFSGKLYDFIKYDCNIFANGFKKHALGALTKISGFEKNFKVLISSDPYYLKEEDMKYAKKYFNDAFSIINEILKRRLDTLFFECK